MSAIKRHIEDKCEEIAAKVGLNPDDVMDIFNIVNEHCPKVLNTDEELWTVVERECGKHAAFLRSRGVGSIKTGYIPVEYNHYKELVKKASEYDRIVKQVEDSMKASKCRSFSLTLNRNDVVLVSDTTGTLKMEEGMD